MWLFITRLIMINESKPRLGFSTDLDYAYAHATLRGYGIRPSCAVLRDRSNIAMSLAELIDCVENCINQPIGLIRDISAGL